MEATLVQRAGYRFMGIPSAGLHGVGLKALPGNLLRLSKGLRAAGKIIKQFQPDGLLLTGGYVSIPVAIAGRKIPSLLYVPDIEPAQAVSLIARFAGRIAVTTPDSTRFYPQKSKVTVTGYPTRSELKAMDGLEARQKLNLKPEKHVVMVFGGSQGAQSMNRSLYPQLPTLLKRFQILHLCGEHNWEETLSEAEKIPADVRGEYHPFAYLHADEMNAAFSAADLVVSRAGAAVMGELPLFGLPAVLVPYPFAWRYQQINARYLEQHGAAIVLQDTDMRGSLTGLLYQLFDNPDTLSRMSDSMRSLATPTAAETIVDLLENLVKNASAPRKAGSNGRS